jgi:hypothetical protein
MTTPRIYWKSIPNNKLITLRIIKILKMNKSIMKLLINLIFKIRICFNSKRCINFYNQLWLKKDLFPYQSIETVKWRRSMPLISVFKRVEKSLLISFRQLFPSLLLELATRAFLLPIGRSVSPIWQVKWILILKTPI